MTEGCFNEIALAWYNYYALEPIEHISLADCEYLDIIKLWDNNLIEVNKSLNKITLPANKCKYLVDKFLKYNCIEILEYDENDDIKITQVEFEIIDIKFNISR